MTAALRKSTQVIAFGIVFLSLAGAMHAQQAEDEAGIGRTITVAPGETRGDIACAQCRVYVRGTVTGDIAVFDGRVSIEGPVSGDVAVFWGDVRLADSASVGGDVAAFGGVIKKSPTATVHGDQASFSRTQALVGAIFSLAICGAVIALLVWLVIWLFRRSRTAPSQTVVRQV